MNSSARGLRLREEVPRGVPRGGLAGKVCKLLLDNLLFVEGLCGGGKLGV